MKISSDSAFCSPSAASKGNGCANQTLEKLPPKIDWIVSTNYCMCGTFRSPVKHVRDSPQVELNSPGSMSPGLRLWGVVGPFNNFHESGGAVGIGIVKQTLDNVGFCAV